MSNDLIIKWKKRCGSACILFLIAVLSPAFSSLAQDPESSKKQEKQSGALIIADMQGNVQFLDGQGKPLETGKIGSGDILPLDHSAVTAQPGKIIFLLSNGTLMTLTENTKMKVRTFEQVPFDPGGKKLKDLENEPSQSVVEIDLDMGSLIIKTRKLDKASSFNINSPFGQAGIRGTEFQIQSNPGAGIQLDVTESTVAFTPPGGGQAMPVGQGNGLSVSQAGVPTPRPINPVVAQTISITNQVATQVTANVSLNVVSGAMNEATAESQSSEESGEGDTDSQKKNSDELESDSGEEASSDKDDGSGDNEQTPGSIDSTPVESEQNPASGENVTPAGPSPTVPAQPPSLSFAVPDVAGKAFDVKRDSGAVEDLDKLGRVVGLLPSSNPPSGFSEEILNRDISLLTNHILSGVFPASARFEQSELDANDLALDVTSVWDHLSSASDLFPLASYSSVVGRNLALGEGTYEVEGVNAFLLGATSDLSYSGEVSFSGSASRVVLIGGNVVSAAAGSKLKLDAALADLVVVSRSDWSVSDAAFAAGSKLYLRGLSDLRLTNVDFTATDLVRLEALMDLSLDSARFSAGLREIQMRATTIDLSNVDFPSSSIVKLHVMKGGLDVKYPTFGSANRAYGRVNFLRNISYGGKANLLQDRSSFDLHGTNIKISKLP